MTTRTASLLACIALAGCGAEPLNIDQPLANDPDGSMAEQTGSQQLRALPTSVSIEAPFASQAPLGNWDPPYDEACEEASLIIVHHYLENTPMDAEVMDSDILGLVAYEESVGLPIDIDMHQLAQVARDVYGYEAEVIEGDDVTQYRIESELARGYPVIVPLAGQDIGNPYYTGDGPPYHVLVIVGYNEREFITHDVGTRHGEDYAYRKDVILDAIHDWTGSKEAIRSGPRRMLVVRKAP